MNGTQNMMPAKADFDPLTVGSLLIVLLVFLYWPVVTFQYVNYDDQNWIYANPQVLGGISLDSLHWALTGVVNSTWCPLTNLSFLIEVHFFGVHPPISHLINLTLHLANVVLLLRFLSRIFGWAWPAALATLFFAIHPMNVEAVAWVSDRKGLLFALFLLLMLTKYFDYARTPSRRLYWQTVLFYFLSLASKPTAITVPLMLLLLDLWPLARFDGRVKTVEGLLTEKIPFFALAAGDALIAFKWQHDSGGIATHPFLVNVQTALVGCARYLSNLVWPVDLNVCYLHPGAWPVSLVVASTLLLLLASFLAVLRWRQDRSLAVCLGLFVLGLAPVLELIPAGHCYMTDRYTYIPYVWLFIVIAPILIKAMFKVPLAALPVGVCVVLLMAVTRQQLATWQNSITLFNRALEVNPINPVAHLHLAIGYSEQHEAKPAIQHIKTAIELQPEDPFYRFTAARMYLNSGQDDEVCKYYQKAYLMCQSPQYISSFATFYASHSTRLGLLDGLNAARLALLIAPSAGTLDDYAAVVAKCGSFDASVRLEREALDLQRTSGLFHQHLGMYLKHQSIADIK